MQLLEVHTSFCKEFDFANIKMPKLGPFNQIPKMKFQNFKNMLKAHYVVYADFEALNVRCHRAPELSSISGVDM